jgi:hypothetical protein
MLFAGNLVLLSVWLSVWQTRLMEALALSHLLKQNWHAGTA